MRVMKFGGTSLGNGRRIKLVSQIIKQYHQQGKVVVVTSAMSEVTDKLISLFKNYQLARYLEVSQGLKVLQDSHFLALEDLQLDKKNYHHTSQVLSDHFKDLEAGLKSHITSDYIISFGERLSSILLSAALSDVGLLAKPVISSEIIVVNKNVEHIEVLMKETQVRVQNKLTDFFSKNTVPVVTGFFATTLEQEIVTLGRGGSDYSATILANVLDAKEVILWKDVDGVFNENPKENAHASPYSDLSYDQAILLAKNGAKILHPECITPVSAKGIIVWVKNTFNSSSRGTRIGESGLDE